MSRFSTTTCRVKQPDHQPRREPSPSLGTPILKPTQAAVFTPRERWRPRASLAEWLAHLEVDHPEGPG